MARVMLVADGVELPNPSSYQATYKDLDLDPFTSDTGELNRNMVAANKVTLSCEWGRLNRAQKVKLVAAISGKESVQLRYIDELTETYKTGKFYATDRNIRSLVIREQDGRYSVSFDFIEF